LMNVGFYPTWAVEIVELVLLVVLATKATVLFAALSFFSS